MEKPEPRLTRRGVFVLALAAPVLLAAKPDPELARLSRMLDQLYRSSSSHGHLRMQIKTPNYERELVMEIWTRGMDDTLVRIESPRKERGTSTLKKGGEMWNYLPKIKKTIRVPPSMMMSGWMGSDFTNDDMVRESSWQDDYDAAFASTSPNGQRCIDYRAKPNAAVAWDRVVACIETNHNVPVRQTFYDEKGRQARVLDFTDVKKVGGRLIPTTLTLIPLIGDKKGNRTVVIYDDLEFDVALPAGIFSLSNLKRGR